MRTLVVSDWKFRKPSGQAAGLAAASDYLDELCRGRGPAELSLWLRARDAGSRFLHVQVFPSYADFMCDYKSGPTERFIRVLLKEVVRDDTFVISACDLLSADGGSLPEPAADLSAAVVEWHELHATDEDGILAAAARVERQRGRGGGVPLLSLCGRDQKRPERFLQVAVLDRANREGEVPLAGGAEATVGCRVVLWGKA